MCHLSPLPTPTEYAFKAAKSTNMTSIAVRGKDSVVVVTQKKVVDKLIDGSATTHLFKITNSIGVCVTGMLADAKAAIQRARQEANMFEYENGYPITTSLLVKRMANVAQLYTQYAFMRALGVITIYVGIDDGDKKPQLYRVDPAGHMIGYRACSAGSKEQEAHNQLEKKIKQDSEPLSYEETLEVAITSLQEVLGTDIRAQSIEVGVVRSTDMKFTTLTEEEIDKILSKISTRD